MTFDATTQRYEEITVCDKPALFTSVRIKRDSVPAGLYAYDVRHDDDCGGFPVRLHHLSWSITGERLFLQSRWSCPMTDGGTLMKRRTGTMIRLEEQRKIKSPA